MTYTRIGAETAINSTLPGQQTNASVVALADGRYMVVWTTDEAGADGNGSAVMGRLFSATGTPIGTEFVMNVLTQGFQSEGDLTLLDNGTVVGAYRSDVSNADPLGQPGALDESVAGIGGRLMTLSAAGVTLDPLNRKFNTTVDGIQDKGRVTALFDGGFVAVYTDFSQTGGDVTAAAVRAQRYDALGNPVGSEILVNTITANGQLDARAAALGDGGFVIIWMDDSQTLPDNDVTALYSQRFDGAGNKIGAQTLVNTTTTGNQSAADIAGWANGRYVAVWQDSSEASGMGASFDVRGQLFNADGTKAGVEFLVDTGFQFDQGEPRVEALADGRFVVVWQSVGEADDAAFTHSVRAQVFAADGTRLGAEFMVNTTTTEQQLDPSLAVTADGKLVVVWTDGKLGVGENLDIKSQVFDLNAATGGAGDDSFGVGLGANTIVGGAGTDTLVVNANYNDIRATTDASGNLVLTGKINGEMFSASVSEMESFRFNDGTRPLEDLTPQTINGKGGNDRLKGGDDIEIINGKRGNDRIEGGGGSDTLNGSRGEDRLKGDAGADILNGGRDNDRLDGGDGHDTLDGGRGKDKLTGGTGQDTFVFSSALKKENRDTIIDFSAADDTIGLDNAVFVGLADGALAAGAFQLGSVALDADDRVLYDQSSGKLFFDADGNGGGKAVEFARVSSGLVLTAEDFIVL
jgi:Ca2+-binding RTX toxin-like protein